jgi:hypothetical protein
MQVIEKACASDQTIFLAAPLAAFGMRFAIYFQIVTVGQSFMMCTYDQKKRKTNKQTPAGQYQPKRF